MPNIPLNAALVEVLSIGRISQTRRIAELDREDRLKANEFQTKRKSSAAGKEVNDGEMIV